MTDSYPASPSRPDPDQLLAQLQQAERAAARGKLRIYFGSNAGVGKTFAMLSAAHKAQQEGREVLIGLVETHGRAETLALVNDLPRLPLRISTHRDRTLEEFDIDAALQRHPQLLLVDELAHTNIAGSRHPKRWQDVEELLSAGIDVWTTLNVQHLESLNDVIGSITGIRIHETLPDSVFDSADEVILVDLPTDELLDRLKAGKVYLPQQAERAAKNFFRKGNLMALREIALRRTAERINDDVKNYRIEQSITGIWRTESGLLACIGPDASAEHVVRSAARMAGQLNVPLHAIYVETPQLQRLPHHERERILATLKLAEELQAKTAVLTAPDAASGVIEYARQNNFSRIIVGRSERKKIPLVGALINFLQPRFAEQLSRLASDIDCLEISTPPPQTVSSKYPRNKNASEQPASFDKRYLWTLLIAALTTVLVFPLTQFFALANIIMLYLLSVIIVAVRFGKGPAAFAAFINVLAFDFFFVEPRFSFSVSDVQYLLTFAVMLAVGLFIGQLTANLRFQARIANHREQRAQTLFTFSRDLSIALQNEQIIEITQNALSTAFSGEVILVLPDDNDRLQPPAFTGKTSADNTTQTALQNRHEQLDLSIAQWVFDHNQEAGFATDTLPENHYRYIPLQAPMRMRGVLAIKPLTHRWLLIPEQQRQLQTFASLVAIALERVHYVEVAQAALVHITSEQLRNSLLTALSHDLRTPLTALVGLADTLTIIKPPLNDNQRDIVLAMRDESLRMSTLVNNLLDMAKLQSGQITLKKDWHSLEEVIGSALRSLKQALATRQVDVQLQELPLIECDAVMIERVIANLVENACKYTPTDSAIEIRGELDDGFVKISCRDFGPGLPKGIEKTVFEKFTRGDTETTIPGAGLGLAICQTIIAAHKGTINAETLADGGACFSFRLPLGQPPHIDTSGDVEIVNHAGETLNHAGETLDAQDMKS